MIKHDVFNGAEPDRLFQARDLMPNDIVSNGFVYYKLDFENFDFTKIDDYGKFFIDRARIQKMLDSCGIDINIEDFIIFKSLQEKINLQWSIGENDSYRWQQVYRQGRYGKARPMLLSYALNQKIAGGFAYSLLAQMYLQHVYPYGSDKSPVLYCGNVFFERNPHIERNGGQSHAYLRVKLGNQQFFYDPLHPLMDTSARSPVPTMPRIMSDLKVPFKAKTNFKDMLNAPVSKSGGFAYVEVSDIYGKEENWLLGFEVSHDADRTEERIKRQTPNQPQSQPVRVLPLNKGGR